MKTVKLFALALAVVSFLAADVNAGGRRSRGCQGGSCSTTVSTCSGGSCATTTTTATPATKPVESKPVETKAGETKVTSAPVSTCSSATCGTTFTSSRGSRSCRGGRCR